MSKSFSQTKSATHPGTVASKAASHGPRSIAPDATDETGTTDNAPDISNDIAIVGMAARLPGADTVEAYWHNLKNGISSIEILSQDTLLANGEAPHLLARDEYVAAAAPLAGYKAFDAEFFGFSPKEAAILDPQHRHFLEVSWEALENAGHVPETFSGPIGVFGGCGMGSYFYFNLCSNRDLVDDTGMFLLRHTGNDKDFMTTRLSHVLDLKGPSINIQTACSTSLVATHYACQSLLNGECDMALAGGVTIELPQGRGYLYKEGEILSPDGQCHAFDHRAEGTVFGSGAGVVVLRRLEDAIADGDYIWAVIKGTAVNNDGAAKAGYLAPSVDGQAAAVAEAHALANVSADTIDYVECHGTGTYLGDPIEVAALTQAFGETSDRKQHCRIGSVKTNIGHLDTAAGVASLIKTSLSLHHQQIPASLGYEAPNPAIDFANGPFIVNDQLQDWPAGQSPRRAGVNSLGVGGTNAHAVLQEAPERTPSEASDFPFQILSLSGRSPAALEANTDRLAQYLSQHDDQPLADIAWTLKEGRRAFEQRRVAVASTHAEAAELLQQNTPHRVFTHSALDNPDVVFMFPGGGAQYAGMARDLYEVEPIFADWMDRGLDHLQAQLEYDIRALWLPKPGAEAAADQALKQPSVQLPLIMITEYALAQLWISWGVRPAALIGHSMGENTAACLAGVISFTDCIDLVHLRGQLFDSVPAGGMLSVALPADQLIPMLGTDLDLASINAAGLSVATGPCAALQNLKARLQAADIDCQSIPIDIAAHSRMLEPILDRFRDFLQGLDLQAPHIPFASNLTGQMITAAEATNPDYWVKHLRNTVLFADGLNALSDETQRVFLEVGPGKALSSLARQHPQISANQVIDSLRHAKDDIADDVYFASMLGRMWAVGVDFDWQQIWGDARRNRVVLPSYAFQHKDYFIKPATVESARPEIWPMRQPDLGQWGYQPEWRPRYADCPQLDANLSAIEPQRWLIFEDHHGYGATLSDRLRAAGHTVITVRPGDSFAKTETGFRLAPEQGRSGYDQLLQDLAAAGNLPDRIAHLWLVTEDLAHRPGSSFFHRTQEHGFYSLLFLMQAMAEQGHETAHMTVITSDMLDHPEKATIRGPIQVIPREFPSMTCATLDLSLSTEATPIPTTRGKRKQNDNRHQLHQLLLEEVLATPRNSIAAWRGGKRNELHYAQIPLPETDNAALIAADMLRQGGTYLITGGFGGIGLTMAEHLIDSCAANIILLARSPLPERDLWDDYLTRHPSHAPISRRLRAVQDLEAKSGRVLVLCADVSNIEDMRRAERQARDHFGDIHGVIHAAGVIHDAPILGKSLNDIEDVFAPKVHGTQVLDQVFPDGSLDWLVLFSSSSTVTAPVGQVDYVAANAYLNAFAQSRTQSQTPSKAARKTRTLALNWGVWADVGMAAESLIQTSHTPQGTDSGQALLGQRLAATNETTQFQRGLSTADWVIAEHQTKSGDILLPGTGYLELIDQAQRATGATGPYEIRDLIFMAPLTVTADTDTQMRLSLSDQDAVQTVQIDSTASDRSQFEPNAVATIHSGMTQQPQALDLSEIAARCIRKQIGTPEQPLIAAQARHMDFGPRWQVLQTTSYGTGEGLAELALPAQLTEDLNRFALHPGLLDIATGWAMELMDGYKGDHLWAPVSYQSVRVFAPLEPQIASWVRHTSATQDTSDRNRPETASFDVTITAPDGRVLLDITGFTIRKLTAGPNLSAPKPAITDRPLRSAAEERLHHNITQGIRQADGADVFLRALSHPANQLVVSSLDLPTLISQADNLTKETRDQTVKGQSFERPELSSEYAAPATPVETQLAIMFQDLLGVDEIGIDDSFFDLGGHSLIAVRLFAQIKKTYGSDFPISLLFEAPTIRKIAAQIPENSASTVDMTEHQGSISQLPDQSAPKFTHIVAMHPETPGPATPFFLVAGMFGNVLNLRHLGTILGNERPFYGLQARGLFGDQPPHTTIEDAARDYIREMREVQPNGPYMLGGFSGGGIIAYEIAQQLRNAGENVAALIMLDTPLPQRRPLTLRDRMAIQAHELKQKGPAYVVQWATRRLRWELDKYRKNDDSAADTTAQFHNSAIEAAFLNAISQYQVAPWAGPLTLFRPPLQGRWQVAPDRLIDHERAYVLHDNDWGQWAAALTVFEVPGDHDSMVLEPNVRVLASRLREILAAQEQTQHTISPSNQPQQKAAE